MNHSESAHPLNPGYLLGGDLQTVLHSQEKLCWPGGVQSNTSQPSAAFAQEELDAFFMSQALVAGMESCGVSAPNPSVGCVLACHGKIVASGCTQAYGGLHGEKVAFDKLAHSGINWEGITAYVTLEPCTHYGKQPPCVDLFLQNKPARVVVACADPNPLVAGQGLARLSAAGIAVTTGVLEKEAKAWHYPFLVQQQLSHPMIAAKWAQSIDGCLTDAWGNWRWISSSASRKYTHWLRQKYDAILVGAGTVLHDFPKLDARGTKHSEERQPMKLIFDPNGRLFQAINNPEILKQLKKSTFCNGSRVGIFFNEQKAGAVENSLREQVVRGKGVLQELCETRFFPLSEDGSAFFQVKQQLCSEDFSLLNGSKPLQSVLVEGGPTLLAGLMEVDAIDACHIFVAPFLMGGNAARIGVLQGPAEISEISSAREKVPLPFPRRLEQCERLKLLGLERIENDIIAEYVPGTRWDRIFQA